MLRQPQPQNRAECTAMTGERLRHLQLQALAGLIHSGWRAGVFDDLLAGERGEVVGAGTRGLSSGHSAGGETAGILSPGHKSAPAMSHPGAGEVTASTTLPGRVAGDSGIPPSRAHASTGALPGLP